MIQLAKLALWALQDNRVASAWHPCDNHVCGAVAISAGEKKDKEKRKIGCNRDRDVLLMSDVLAELFESEQLRAAHNARLDAFGRLDEPHVW
jgi:hypothetical protein